PVADATVTSSPVSVPPARGRSVPKVVRPPEAFVALPRAVPTPVPRPVNPLTGATVAVIVPDPETPSEAPVPTTMAAVVFVPPVSELKADEPLPLPQAPVAGTTALA